MELERELEKKEWQYRLEKGHEPETAIHGTGETYFTEDGFEMPVEIKEYRKEFIEWLNDV